MNTLSSAQFSPETSGLELPFDAPRSLQSTSAQATSRLAQHSFILALASPPPSSAWSRESLLLAAFGLQLSRYNSQSSIPLTVAWRTADGTSRRSSVLQISTPQERTGRELLTDVAAQLLDPPGAVMRPAADGMNRAAVSFFESEEAGGGPDPTLAAADDFDLHLCLFEDGRRAAFRYDPARFRRTSIERFAAHLELLLAGLTEQLDHDIWRLPMLPPAERAQLEEVGRGAVGQREFQPVHELFERCAAATPEATALRYRDESLTYQQLNRRANRLAHYLRSIGTGVECRVAVCVEPSFDIAVSLLAILKAGAVYVPLDPTYPAARILAILDDTQPTLVVSSTRLIERLALANRPCLPLDECGPLDRFDDENPNLALTVGQTAYVYYTSGTTGRPKGVMASQGNLAAYLRVARERYAFNHTDVMPAIARYSFSISMFELLSPLTVGGTLVILDREHVMDPERLAQTLSEVTSFHAGPSLLKRLLPYIREHQPDFARFAKVRHASSGGDLIAPELLEGLKEIFTNAEIFVIYGCSEISCMGCTYPVPRDRPVVRTFVGRPFEDMAVKVLDRALNPVPIGVPGEIYFAGTGVVKGYLGRPDLSAERFITMGKCRYYRTGDLGRWSEDGWLELIGRNDFQIKMRGMRIELAEVEHHLRSAPAVRDGVVVARTMASGEKGLIAYFVFQRKEDFEDETQRRVLLSAVRRHMTEQLPDYMVPAIYVALEAMPLNHNMKLDRNALPEPPRADERAASDADRSLSETEKRLGALWQKLLCLEYVGLDDNFFELGGDSLLAAELLVAIEKELSVCVDGMDVLRESLEVLASICDQRRGEATIRSGARPSPAPAREMVTTLFFGHSDSLYGVFREPTGARRDLALLICPPLGRERARTYFVLTRLGVELAARGVSTMHFDYFGSGDSLGENIDGNCSRWQRDIGDAYRELGRRSGATRIVTLGVRLGATLLSNAWQERLIDPSGIFFWDPICDGAAFSDKMRRMHRAYVREMQHLRLGRPLRHVRGGEELMGSTYSHLALLELRRLSIPNFPAEARIPISWLSTSQQVEQRLLFKARCASADARLEELGVDCAWEDTAQFDEILPDHGIVKVLCDFTLGRV
jgi:amino acid adenylation domain-containing protein